MHIGPEEREYHALRNQPTRYPPGFVPDRYKPVIHHDTAERWLKGINVAGVFVLGMLIGAAIKWWLS